MIIIFFCFGNIHDHSFQIIYQKRLKVTEHNNKICEINIRNLIYW